MDADGSGEIGLQEFMQACVNKESLLDENSLKQSFTFFDKDNSGAVTADELKEALGVGKNISEAVWREVIQEVDENGDGMIDFEEFKMMMRSLIRWPSATTLYVKAAKSVNCKVWTFNG